ncbi:MAG TPA: D-aminoacylase [Ktedonobacteraceae bacterium]|jgi:N-acyl-D-aspartate/D-glutamate deacylase
MYDLLIRHARVVDGSGRPAFGADVGIVKNRIVAVGTNLSEDAVQSIDAGGQVLAPGFVDAHTHDDLAVLRWSTLSPKICQGVTTVVIGNCGFGLAPMVPEYAPAVQEYSAAVLGKDDQPWPWRTMGAFLDTLRATPMGQNVSALLAHGPLRVAAMGFEQRAATEQEMLVQEDLVEEAMQAGAAGMSLGLAYVPGAYTPTSELVRLARIVGRHGGVVASHMRGESSNYIGAINEMLAIAEQAEVAVHLSHLKVTGQKNWGTINNALDLIADARARGIDVTIDMYPYNAGSTTITQLLPSWVFEGGTQRMLERLQDPAERPQILRGVAAKEIDWERIYISAVQLEEHKSLEGINMVQAAEQLHLSPEEALFQLILREKGQISVIMFTMDQRDVDQVAQADFTMIGSDGLPILTGRPHPRLYGTFPQFIERYVREQRCMTLEQAIYKLATFPAQRFRLTDRGSIAPDSIADLVIFDPDTIHDRATYSDPQVYPAGISAVIVSGQPVVLAGQLQSALPGQLIEPVRQTD